jgi:hypothetical protein
MSESNSLLAFFSQQSNTGGIIVKEQPKIDLDLYISNYTGPLLRRYRFLTDMTAKLV